MSWALQLPQLPPMLLPYRVESRKRISAGSARSERAISIEEVPPNAVRRESEPGWRGGFSLGVDLGQSRSGLALSKGFAVRPLGVLELRGKEFDNRVMEMAEKEEADEFIIGLPKAADGSETPQSNKVRSVAGRLAVLAAQRGWRVYLIDEHGTSKQALDRMLHIGLKKSARKTKIDAYAAVMILERYFSMPRHGIELVLPKHLDLQEKILRGPPPPQDNDFWDE